MREVKVKDDIDYIIIEALEYCNYKVTNKAISDLKDLAKRMVSSPEYIYFLNILGWFKVIEEMDPSNVLPPIMYYMDELDNAIVMLICNKLRLNLVEATRRQIHELSYKTQDIFNTCDRMNTLTDAANRVIDIFVKGDWITPDGFQDVFRTYRCALPKHYKVVRII